MVNIIYPDSWDDKSDMEELDEEMLMMDTLMEENKDNNTLFWKMYETLADSGIPKLDKYDEAYRGMKN